MNAKKDFTSSIAVLDERRKRKENPSWETLKQHEAPPMLFEIRFLGGRSVSFAYNDIREIECRDAGHLMLGIMGMTLYHITIEGRHLDQLNALFRINRINWIAETEEDLPEDFPMIEAITIELLTK